MQLDGKKIKIVGMVFTVQLENKLIDGNDRVNGLVELEDCVIKIDKSLNHQTIMQTLLHEITHAMLWIMGNDDYDDEKFVVPFSNIMYQVFKENEIDVK